jgi:subtilisin-like proprotein convertase family protein
MKKLTFFIFIILSVLLIFNLNVKAEYGQQNYNRILTGLGIAASYAGINSQTAFDRNTNGSLEMWVYPTNVSGTQKTLISKGANPDLSFCWSLGTDGKMILRIGTFDFINTDGNTVILNNWSHVAVTWTGGPNYTVKFYINGIKSGSDIVNSASWNVNTDQIRIGTSQAFPTNFFQGNIDEVRYWASEIPLSAIIANRFIGLGDAANANTGSAITASSFYASLISSWTFNNSAATAYDYISGYNGTYFGSATTAQQVIGIPVPYNFALRLGGSNTDNVRIPHISSFNQTTDGTIELWYKPLSFTAEQVLISKGSTPAALSFILGVVATTGKLYFGHGTSVAQNASGVGLSLNQWNHIAVTWLQIGATYEIRFYRNGKLNGSPSIINASFPVNTDPVWIGNSAAYVLPAKGWVDEFRFWAPVLTESQIQFNMFNSCRAYTNTNMVGAWNFDGNLNNFSAYSGINATFNNGALNNCRFSGFSNDTVTGAPGLNFISHTTVTNRTGTPNPYPYGFNSKNLFLPIPDNNATGVSDSLFINTDPVPVTSVEVLLSIDHPWVGDLTVSLRAPNGTTKNIIANSGSSGDNVLAFFADEFTNTLSTPFFNPPWSFVKPNQAFGNFGSSTMNGYWLIKCVDGAGGDVGILKGWGIRFNSMVAKENNSSEIPKQFTLFQNYPNPFNPVTKITYGIPEQSFVKLTVYDIVGREVSKLVNEMKLPGIYNASFDGSNLSSGVYYYKIEAGDFIQNKKMILVK